MIICCEHNRCPARPTWFLGRFRERPWRCPQCGRFWVTVNEVWGFNSMIAVPWRWVEVVPHTEEED